MYSPYLSFLNKQIKYCKRVFFQLQLSKKSAKKLKISNVFSLFFFPASRYFVAIFNIELRDRIK